MGYLTSPAQLNPAFFRKTPVRGIVQTDIVCRFGTSSDGYLASYTSDHPDITAVRSGVGTINLTFPPCTSAVVSVREIYSPALTVIDGVITAKSITAGTATVKVLNASGSATDPASGDVITLRLDLGSEV